MSLSLLALKWGKRSYLRGLLQWSDNSRHTKALSPGPAEVSGYAAALTILPGTGRSAQLLSPSVKSPLTAGVPASLRLQCRLFRAESKLASLLKLQDTRGPKGVCAENADSQARLPRTFAKGLRRGPGICIFTESPHPR